MKQASRIGLVTMLLVAGVSGFSGHSDDFPKDYFRSPLGIPLTMAGNFAEMRADHFHSGLDLKTDNREGLPVYAAADGWVSRVKVSPFGYGNVLYVSHPNGYTTVYAHLSTFSDEVASYVKTRQYAASQFEVDKYLSKNQFPVSKGDVIAHSGNTGSSAGPHLHFEIRSSGTQTPLNPLLFGLQITDTLPPKIFRIKVYPGSERSYAEIFRDGGREPVVATHENPVVLDAVAVDPSGRRYELVGVDRIQANGVLGFGVQVHDYQDGSNNRLGAYTIKLLSDDALLFESELARFTFGQTRYINAHVDYAEYKEHRRWIQRSHKLPGNALDIYSGQNNGFLSVDRGDSHVLRYEIEDASGNATTLEFEVTGTNEPSIRENYKSDQSYHVIRDEAKTIAGDGMRVHFPANTFYDDLDFVYSVSEPAAGSYSSIYSLQNESVPLHRSMTVSIRADAVPEALRAKAVLARVSEEGKLSSAGGAYSDGYVVSKPRTFGRYTVSVDTTAPTIEPYRFPKDGSFRSGQRIQFKIGDDFSGLRSYTGTIDSQWVLFEYDAKRSLVSYQVDDRVNAGGHKLVVTAEDGKGNLQSYARQITIDR